MNHRHLISALVVSVGLFSACTDSSGSLPTTVVPTTIAVAAPTIPPPPTTQPPPTTTSTTTSTTSTTTTTTTEVPTTTIAPVPNAGAPVTVTATGEAINTDVAATARSVYEAAVNHNYDRLRDIIGDRRFRWGFAGDRRPADAWRKQLASGKGDELARIVTLLETAPGVDDKGNTVWPYLAVKPTKEWTPADEQLLTGKLGFSPENVEQTKTKGSYEEYRLTIDSKGIWTGFHLGY